QRGVRMRPKTSTRILAGLSYASATIIALACESAATNPVPPIPKIALVSGGNQQAERGTILPLPILVIATDSSGHSLAGQKITFAVTSGGGSVAPETVTTHSLGYAQASWTLGPNDGPQTMTASVGASIVTIRATAAAPKLLMTNDPFDYYYYAYSSLNPTLGIGQYIDAYVGPAKVSPLSASLPISFSHTSGVTDVPASVTIPTGNEFAPFRITAISIGVDSLVASAPGYAPLTVGF